MKSLLWIMIYAILNIRILVWAGRIYFNCKTQPDVVSICFLILGKVEIIFSPINFFVDIQNDESLFYI